MSAEYTDTCLTHHCCTIKIEDRNSPRHVYLQGIQAQRRCSPLFIDFQRLQTQVDLDVAPDYHHFVKPEDEMWLHQISNKTRALAYSDRTQLLSDIEAIRGNCLAYNTPGCGQYGGPGEAQTTPCKGFH